MRVIPGNERSALAFAAAIGAGSLVLALVFGVVGSRSGSGCPDPSPSSVTRLFAPCVGAIWSGGGEPTPLLPLPGVPARPIEEKPADEPLVARRPTAPDAEATGSLRPR
jgi:hypothetical protein